MEIVTEPVYISATAIKFRGNGTIKLSTAVNKLYPGECFGAQLINITWYIYVRSDRTRAGLIVSGLDIDGEHYEVHDTNINKGGSKLSERVLIKDLPATLPNDRILKFLMGFPNVRVKSKVIYAKERIGGEEMSPFINGDRLIYVVPDVSPPLPKETVIGGHPCRIWHKSQKNYCKRCATHGHRTSDIGMCEAYDADAAVVAFRANNNPLSNYYQCTVTINNVPFRSSEHAYQWKKCKNAKRPDLAERILGAATPADAKLITEELTPDENVATWDAIKNTVMEYVLKSKWNCSGRFRQTLMATHGMTIAEATQDTYWGVGVAPNLAQSTKPSKFLGTNHLGRLLQKIRDEVQHSADTTGISTDNIVLKMPPTPAYSEVLPHIECTSTTPCDKLSVTPPPLDSNTDGVPQNTAGGNTHADANIETSTVLATTDSTPLNDNTDPIDPSATNDSDILVEGSNIKSLQPVVSHSTNSPHQPPRQRSRSKLGKKKEQKSTLDRFVKRDCSVSSVSSEKRKASSSSDIVSPSSTHISKAVRTDERESIS